MTISSIKILLKAHKKYLAKAPLFASLKFHSKANYAAEKTNNDQNCKKKWAHKEN
jgi:hypothetical protein